MTNCRSARIVALLTVVLATVQTHKCASYQGFDYLDLPTKKELEGPFHKAVRDALLKLAVPDGAAHETVVDALEEGLDDEAASSSEREIYAQLSESTVDSLDDCRRKDVFRSVLAAMKAKLEPKLEKFDSFLREQGAKKFSECATLAEEDFVKRKEPTELNELNSVFREAFDMHLTDDGKLDLQWKLRNLDLESDELNAAKLVKAIKARDAAEAKTKDKYALIKNFLLSRCNQLRASFVDHLESVSLARHFGFMGPINIRLLIMNEYNRLCLALEKEDKRDAVEMNIRRQLDSKTTGPCRLFSSLRRSFKGNKVNRVSSLHSE
jgi:hypothetical protein